jgi:hypothetical protein
MSTRNGLMWRAKESFPSRWLCDVAQRINAVGMRLGAILGVMLGAILLPLGVLLGDTLVSCEGSYVLIVETVGMPPKTLLGVVGV